MTIAQSTTIQGYQLHKGGTRARLAIFRMIAAESKTGNRPPSVQIEDWRKSRYWTMGSYVAAYCSGLNAGFNGEGRARCAVWYSHTGENFRNEKYADECGLRSIRHTGWFTDVHQLEKARGIVASLSHGRFIAGYEWDSNGERVYFDAVHDSETDAAHAANEHARVFAETSREYSEKFKAAQKIEDENEERFSRLRECLALRNNPCFVRLRAEALELIEAIREARETLKTEYAGVL